jgi:RNA 2',3'-cyclic 3'-phosphodiesterase
VEAFLQASGRVATAPFRAESFGLFESTLTPEGAVYTMVERYKLG